MKQTNNFSRDTVRFHQLVISLAKVRPTLAIARILYFHFRTAASLSEHNTYPREIKTASQWKELIEYFNGATAPRWYMSVEFDPENLTIKTAVFYKEGTRQDKAQFKLEFIEAQGLDFYYRIVNTSNGEILDTFGIEYK